MISSRGRSGRTVNAAGVYRRSVRLSAGPVWLAAVVLMMCHDFEVRAQQIGVASDAPEQVEEFGSGPFDDITEPLSDPMDAAPNMLPGFVDDPDIAVFGPARGEALDGAGPSEPIDIFGRARASAAERELPEDIPPVQPTSPDNPFLPVQITGPDFSLQNQGLGSQPGSSQQGISLNQGSNYQVLGQGARIATFDLGMLDSGGVGLSEIGERGMGLNLFRGMSHDEATRLIAALPISSDSSVLHQLRRTVLLTGAVPRGETSGLDLLTIRLERLAAQGDVLSIISLAEASGSVTENEQVAVIWADAYLAAGNNALACNLANEFIASSDQPYWFKLLSFCQILGGEAEVAQLGSELLMEQDVEDDAYYLLLAKLTGDELQEFLSLPDASPLHLAMVQAAGLQIPPDAFESANKVVQFALARAPNSDLPPRLRSMLDGERRGVFERNKVAEIYAALPFAPQELIAYEQRGTKPSGPLLKPFLFQMAMSASSDARRAQILSEMWPTAEELASSASSFTSDDTYGISLASLPAVRMIAPNPDLARFAAGIVRALVLGGDYARAEAWFAALGEASAIITIDENPHISAASLELWPIMQFVAAADPDAATSFFWPQEQAQIWGSELLKEAPEDRRRWMALFFTMAEALGHPADEVLSRRFMDRPFFEDGSTPSYHIWRGLGRAAAGRRVGEVAILSLIALGENGVRQAHPAVISTVLSALAAVGLTREANQLAAEILIARGP